MNSDMHHKEWRELKIEFPAELLDDMLGVSFNWKKGKHRVFIENIRLVLDGEVAVEVPRLVRPTKHSNKIFRKILIPKGATANNSCQLVLRVRKAKDNDAVAGEEVLVTPKDNSVQIWGGLSRPLRLW